MSNMSEFDWIAMKKEIGSSDEGFHEERGSEKFIRKFKENPLVPLGALLTSTCLGLGLYSFRKGQPKMSQLMMRARIGAQAFTIVVLIGGMAIKAYSDLPQQQQPKG